MYLYALYVLSSIQYMYSYAYTSVGLLLRGPIVLIGLSAINTSHH